MFPPKVYIERRNRLKNDIKSGLILFLGNDECPATYPDNHYAFRQDASFLYFYGLDFPSLAAVIDIDNDSQIIFGDDLTIDQIVWTGIQPSLSEKCQKTGISQTAPLSKLPAALKKALRLKRKIHFLPPYRSEHLVKLEKLLDIHHTKVHKQASKKLIRAVVAQREIKSSQEIEQIQQAIGISREMQLAAFKSSKPGVYEREIAGLMEGIAIAKGCRLAFTTIFSIHGETLHNPYYHNLMKAGNMAVNDSGAESLMHYASDITRTVPIGGKFSPMQKEIYNIVFNAQQKAIEAVHPGIEFHQVHLLACTVLAEGLKNIGLMKGNIADAVHEGAHALFFQCGLGHNLGLDVHDMEGLGEDFVGYTENIKRNQQFGIRSLRLAKKILPGFVVTVEPGIYLIPQLIDQWKSKKKFSQFINYDLVEKYRSFGGIRLEDDILVTETDYKNLSSFIPSKIDEVESITGK